ncbi:hypothetical protein [Wolbachia endosymbiont (group A) of Sphaerophoria taeniata]|uniref:hypothetical protein n=1 Tax=Wolbachia endosymbiont (group A) of Sphaerophoria taeniata TaxID=2954057 RepID=UPI002227777D|nr:hypothetical protein [Wolbachia endosymbiont (group A) of Sphaerophoria taeniata]
MAKGNNTLLIFDFDNTITNGHMHNIFSGKHSGFKKSDFNSGAEYAVKDTDIGNFLKNTGGVKNKETLKSVLQSALSNGVKVNIASYTGYSDAVRRVVENHLGLSKEQAGGISVFGGFPGDYDNELPKGLKEQKNQVGKNLHICKAIVEYKDKHGELPKTVMLVDDDVKNIQKINEFVASMSKREEWLEKNGLSIEEIQKIKFEGARVPKEDKNVGYLERIQEFVNANLVQEPIYENLKKEEPIYQNLQDIQRSLSETVPKEPIYQNNENRPPLPPKKRKSSDGMVADGENKKQDIKDMSSSETHANPTRSKRHAMMLDPQQIESIHQNAEELSPGKKYAHIQIVSLAQEFKAIKAFFKDCAQEIIDAICNLFKREVATKIEGQGYNVSSKQGSSEITVKGSKPIDASRINKDIIVESLAQIIEKKEKIKDLNNNYKDDQLGREISKLLNAGSQKENINSNYNDGEPIFQTREEASNYPPQKKDINSNSVRGNYNDGESIFQTVQEARNYHRQKKGIDSNPVSKKPLAPPVPPKNYTEKVTQNRNNNIIERGGRRFV